MKIKFLDEAIAAFEDETSDATLGERISFLRDALRFSAFTRLKAIHLKGTKVDKNDKESVEENFKQIECMKQFKIIEAMYNSDLRQMKLSGKNNEDKLNADFLRAIKNMKSSIGEIVATIPINGNGHI